LFLQPSSTEQEWLLLIDGGKKERRLDVYSTFEIIQVRTNSVLKKFHEPSQVW
jgi:hypothetical protein